MEDAPAPVSRLKTLHPQIVVLSALFVTLCLVTVVSGLLWHHQTHLPPSVTIEGVAVGGLTPEAARQTLQQNLAVPTDQTVVVAVDDIQVASSASELGLHRDFETPLAQAQALTTQGHALQRLQNLFKNFSSPLELSAPLQYQPDALAAMLTQLQARVDTPSQPPSAELKVSGSPQSLVLFPGKAGRHLDTQATAQRLQGLAQNQQFAAEAQVASGSAPLSELALAAARERSLHYVKSQVVFTYDTISFRLTDKDLISFLRFPEGYDEQKIATKLEEWKKTVNRPPQDAVFEYDANTLAVTKFVPHKDGLQLDQAATQQKILESLAALDVPANQPAAQATQTEQQTPATLTHQLAVIPSPPATPLSGTNNLGIVERIGVGESWYAGSIPSRVHNVQLAAQRVNHVIVPPGQEFSFNQAIGDVSQATGFQQAYVIMGGRTVLGDGGGVCQVSTTIFRALLDSGLEITRRLPHSYRVGYYEQNFQPGFDATVYSGNVDLRFKNDSPGHVLVHTSVDTPNRHLVVEIYGTSDGRTTEISNYQSWDARPAPPPQYIPDPSLPAGQTKQIDWAVAGLKTKFTHTVRDKQGNVIRTKDYTSNYIPWAAKYLQGAG